MTGSWWWDLLLGLGAALLLAWVALLVVLAIARPRGGLLREALRILPDVLRLLRRLAADETMPRAVRVRLALLLVYLAVPIDLVPDFIPVLGHADDAIIVTVVLRGVVCRAGLTAVRRHWPGTNDGFAALTRLTGLTRQTPTPRWRQPMHPLNPASTLKSAPPNDAPSDEAHQPGGGSPASSCGTGRPAPERRPRFHGGPVE